MSRIYAMEMKKQNNDVGLEIAVGGVAHAGEIARFQVAMAMESEDLSLDEERVRRGVQAVLDDEAKGLYVIAQIAGAVVGCLMITREWSDWNSCWYWWIQSVYVLPEYRGRGIYKAMYSKVIDLAKSSGVTQIRLYVDKANSTAQAVYKKLGMVECHYCLYEKDLNG